MRAAIAAEAGVDVSRVRITVQLASLLVGFEIDVDSTSGPTAGAANALAVEERLATMRASGLGIGPSPEAACPQKFGKVRTEVW